VLPGEPGDRLDRIVSLDIEPVRAKVARKVT